MFVHFSLPVVLVALAAIAHVVSAADPTAAILGRLHQIQVRTPKRQSSNNTISLSDFPVQCQKGCTVAVNALNTCSAASCLCNAAVDSSLQQCINCTVNTQPSATVVQKGQEALDNYNTLCKGTGVSTLSLSFSTSHSGSSVSDAYTSASAPADSGGNTGTAPGPTATITTLPSLSNTAPVIATPTPMSTSIPTLLPSSSSAAIRVLPSFGFASIGLVILFFTLLLA